MIPKKLMYELLESYISKDSQQVESNADLDQILKEINEVKELLKNE